MCYIQGKTRDEAARQLGWSLGTFKRRLQQAREILRHRLARRGMPLHCALAAVALDSDAKAAVPAALVVSTAKMALPFGAGWVPASGGISTHAGALAEGVIKGMLLSKIKVAVVLILAAGLAAADVGLIAHGALEANLQPCNAATGELAASQVPTVPASQKADSDLHARPAVARLEPPDPTEAKFIAPGPNTAQVIGLLQRIQKEASKSETDFYSQDILLKGRISRAWQAWKAGVRPPSPTDLPPPRWSSFLLVQKNGKRRGEFDLAPQEPAAKESSGKVYRLMDGEAFYKLDVDYLEITGNADATTRWWRDFAGEYSRFERGHDGRESQPLSQLCSSLIDRLNGRAVNKDSRISDTVRCYDEHGLLIVDFDRRGVDPATAQAHFGYVYWIDPHKGYRLVKRFSQQHGPTGGLDTRGTAELQLREVTPGVFVIKKATSFASILGSTARKERRAGWQRTDLEIDEVKVGDFPFNEALFDKASLPIPIGARVVDSRYDPPHRFIHSAKSIGRNRSSAMPP